MNFKLKELIWDAFNRQHIKKHNLTPFEVNIVCNNIDTITYSFRKRLLLTGKNKEGSVVKVVLSPEDKNGVSYKNGVYYVVTAYYEGQYD